MKNFNCLLLLSIFSSVNVFGASHLSELYRIADVQLSERPVAMVPDIQNINGPHVYQNCFVFSAQDQKGEGFNLHCRCMSVDEYMQETDIKEYAGEVVATGCVRAVISRTPCYEKGLILDCAKERDDSGLSRHCDMYLLVREGNKLKTMSFAEQANAAKLFSCPVIESLYFGRDSESNLVAKVWLFRTDDYHEGRPRRWSIVEAKVDLNSFTNISEHVMYSYEDFIPQGLSM